MPNKSRSNTLNHLNRLREKGLLRSAALNPELGNSSELYWQLTRAGAAAFGLKFGSQYARRPTPDMLEFKGWQLELGREVANAGWELIRPEVYSPGKPRPSRTRQYQQLVITLDFLEQRAIEEARIGGYLSRQRLLDYEDGDHRRLAPKTANDYLAYTDSAAIVFILFPPGAGEKFWQGRQELYRKLVRKITVAGVFAEEERAQAWNNRLTEAGMKALTLGEIAAVLKDLED